MQIRYDYYKWLIWSILSLAFVIVFIHRFGMAVIADDLSRTLQLTGTQLSNLAGMNFYAYALMQIPAGMMVDYIGPRKIAAVGMLFAGVGSIFFSFADSIWMAFAGRLIVGLGVAVIFVSIMKIQAEWFQVREFSTMSGLTSFIGSMGSLIATTPLALLVMWIGWRQSYQVLGYVTLVFALGIFLLVRNKPADMGFVNPNEDPEKLEVIPLFEGLKRVLKNKYTWPCFFVPAGFVAPVLTFLGVWGVSYLVQVHGIEKDVASGYIFFFALGTTVAGPVVGWLSDRMGKKRELLLTAAILFTVLWAVFIYLGKYLPHGVFPVIFFVIGFLDIFHILAFANVKEVNHARLTGIATSVINAGEFAISAVTNLLVGVILDFFWRGRMVDGVRYYSAETYQLGFGMFILLGMMAIVASYLMKEKKDIVLVKKMEEVA